MTASLLRLRGLARKEIKQILRDPSAILIAFLMPIVLLVVNGFGISLDASEMKLAVVIQAPEESVRGLLQAIDASPYLAAQRALSTRNGESAMIEGRVRGMLVLRDNFSQRASRTASWPAPAQLVVNGTDPNTARLLEGYVAGALQVWLAGQASEKRLASTGGIDLQYRDWFNPELRSADFIVPGIIAMVMTMTGTLLTALIVSREWERGTMESMLASPARMAELIAAKLGCYFVLGMASMGGSVALAIALFGLPYRGGIGPLTAAAALFLIFALGLGTVHLHTGAQSVRRLATGVPHHDDAGNDAVRHAVRHRRDAALAPARHLRRPCPLSRLHIADAVSGRRCVGSGVAEPGRSWRGRRPGGVGDAGRDRRRLD